jgi:hypothetical protein
VKELLHAIRDKKMTAIRTDYSTEIDFWSQMEVLAEGVADLPTKVLEAVDAAEAEIDDGMDPREVLDGIREAVK